MARRKPRWPRISRDAILFSAGLAGIFHETVLGNSDRPTLLFLFATMVGLPAFLRQDEREHYAPDGQDLDDEPKPKRPAPKTRKT